MVQQLPGSRKRCNEPPTAVRVLLPAPATTVEMEPEDGFTYGTGPLLKRVKAVPQLPLLLQQDMSCYILDQPGPFGLKLNKSQSLVDLIQKKLSQEKSSEGLSVVDKSISETPKKKVVKAAARAAGKLLKPSNFRADVSKIGTWEYIDDMKVI